MERNANHIIPSYCPLRAVSHRFNFLFKKPVFRVFGKYLKCFNNKMVQGNNTNIMFESKQGVLV